VVELTRHGRLVSYVGAKADIRVLKDSLKVFDIGALNTDAYIEKRWDGYVRFYNSVKRTFPIGLIDRAIEALEEAGIEYELFGFKTPDLSWVTFSEPFLLPERDYQRKSILAFLGMGIGIIKVPTRGGKTFIASEICRILLERHPEATIMFVTELGGIYRQNGPEIANFIGLEMGNIRQDKIEPKQFTMAMVQTLQSKKKAGGKAWNKLLTYFKKVDFVIIDEVQEFGSSSRLSMLRQVTKYSKMVLGLSATPFKDNDPLGAANTRSICGDIVYDIPEDDLIERKVLAENRILLLHIEHNLKRHHERLKYFDLREEVLVRSDRRNDMILKVIKTCRALKLKVLVMFDLVEHGKIIADKLRCGFLHGEYSDIERDLVKEDYLERNGGVLLVTTIWKKGITLPPVEVFLNASGGKESSNIIQKRGRVLGVDKSRGKVKAVSIDFLDDFPLYFGEHSLNRISAYEKQAGANRIDIMYEEEMSGLFKYLKDWFDGTKKGKRTGG
jgi:superfamily II DNA or RNA helicase